MDDCSDVQHFVLTHFGSEIRNLPDGNNLYLCAGVAREVIRRIRNEKIMKRLFTAASALGKIALLVLGLSSCASTEVQKPAAQKEREARYSDYINNIETGWSINF